MAAKVNEIDFLPFVHRLLIVNNTTLDSPFNSAIFARLMLETPWIIFYAFAGIAFLQILHHLFFYSRMAWGGKRKKKEQPIAVGVSVIVCARNEDTNLKQHLPLLLQQDYPEFEIIVVDDNSDDGTTEYLYYLAEKEPKLKRVKVGNVNKPMAGKKFPLTLGIKAAAFPVVLLTDADCRPASNQWIRQMMEGYQTETEVVLGFAPYNKTTGWLNKTIRFDTFFTALNYLSYALAGIPYMGVGRNLSYKAEMFFRFGGFADHRELPSGDDDLFINKIARKRNTRVVVHPDTFMYSNAEANWEDWKEQKNRHLSTAKYYRGGHKFLLALQPITQILMYFMLPVAILLGAVAWYIPVAIFLFRWILLRLLYTPVMRKLDEKDLIPFIELFDLLQVFYYFRFMKAAVVKTKYRWN